jgi:tetratricopeptide (TPR) repeat protein
MAAGLLDRPSLLQQAAAARRTGVITVAAGEGERRIHLQQGTIAAIGGHPAGGPDLFARALVWVGAAPPATGPEVLAAVPRDGRLDALDALFEEELGTALGMESPRLSFTETAVPDPWEGLQLDLGHAAQPGGILLECLRRQDELVALAPHLPERGRIYLPGDGSWPEGAEPVADARRLVASGGPWTGEDLLGHPWLAPWRCLVAAALLVRSGLIRPATVAETVVQGDAWRSAGDIPRTEAAYRSAAAQNGPARVLSHLADLAEARGAGADAAAWHLRAADHGGPAERVVHLRSAMRLGADREPCLVRLVELYRGLDERDGAVEVLLEMAALQEQRGARDLAAISIREALTLGADPVAGARTLARLAALEGDEPQARLQLEQAARLAGAAGRTGESLAAWEALVALDPGRCDWARDLAELLVLVGRPADALVRLRAARDEPAPGTGDALLADLDRRITTLDPDDHEAHDRLAAYLSRTRDRDGALAQLRQAAAAQERAGDLGALIQSLERIVALGGGQPADEAALALACARAGLDRTATGHWCAAIDRHVADGALAQARNLCVEGLNRQPWSLVLRARLAVIAERAGDQAAAIEQYRAAADLALGTGDRVSARSMLVDLCRLRPDLLFPRIQLAELLRSMGGDQPGAEVSRALDRLYRDIVRIALRRNDQGTALDFARRRLVLPLDHDAARSDLIALLNRLGYADQELAEGRKLLDDLLERGEFERAVDLLSRLVVSRPDDPELVCSLAEAHAALGHTALSLRCGGHAATLCQAAGDDAGARRMLSLMEESGESEAVLAAAAERLAAGQSLDWIRIRGSVARSQRRRIAEDLSSGHHRAVRR